jgi:hypothetical protein
MTTIYATTASLDVIAPLPAVSYPERSHFRFSELLQSQQERRLCRAAIILGSLATITAVVGIILLVAWQ